MTDKKSADAGQAQVQSAVDSAEAKGYIGEEVDPIDNDKYSIKTGPESPTPAEQAEALAKKES